MILWYYQIWPKVVWKVHGAWIDFQSKDYHYDKEESVIFSVQYIIAKTM